MFNSLSLFGSNSATAAAERVGPPSRLVRNLEWAEPQPCAAGAINTAPMCLEDRLCEIFARILTQMQNDLLAHAEETAAMQVRFAGQQGGVTQEQGEMILQRHRLESRGWDLRTETLQMYQAMAKSLKESTDRVLQSLA